MFKRVRQTDGQKSDLDSKAHKVTLAKIVKELLSYIRDLRLPKLQKYMWPTAWGQHRPSSGCESNPQPLGYESDRPLTIMYDIGPRHWSVASSMTVVVMTGDVYKFYVTVIL